MKIIFVVNPMAGAGKAPEEIRKGIAALPEAADCEVYETKGVGDATAFVAGRIAAAVPRAE